MNELELKKEEERKDWVKGMVKVLSDGMGILKE